MTSDLMRKLIAEHPELLKRGGAFRRSEVHESAEWMRIVGLPRRELNLDAVPDLTPLFRTPGGTMRLWPVQSAALLEAEACGGAFLAMPVGTGKALTAALMPHALPSKCAVLLVPPQSKRKKLEDTFPSLAQHFNLPPLHVVSYSELERAPGDVLERLRPDLIIADEGHYLKNRSSARTWRWEQYMKANPATRFVVMSGTFTLESILDYAHLVKWALRERSPVPASYMVLQEWAEALDVSDNPRPPGALERLCERKEHVHHTFRDRFRCRFTTARGVVSVPLGYKAVSLIVRARPLAVPAVVSKALEKLRQSWELGNPDFPEAPTEEVNDDLSFSRYLRQLACGFYLRWDWPNAVRDEEWIASRAGWDRTVRHILRYCRSPSLSSPLLVANQARRGGLDREAQAAWEAWALVKERKAPPSAVVWLHKFMVHDAIQWAQEFGGLVWYRHVPIGDALEEAGMFRPQKAHQIRTEGPQALSLEKFHKDIDGLQHSYSHMLYTSWPNAKYTEQSLGRLHREGQRRTVVADCYLHTPETMDRFYNTRRQAEYIQTHGFGEQKILWAQLEGIDL